MKARLLLLLLTIFPFWGFSAPVDSATAVQYAQLILSKLSSKPGTYEPKRYYAFRGLEQNERLIHVINFDNPAGFVLLAADDRSKPLIAYSSESQFHFENLSPSQQKWMEGYKKEMEWIIYNHVEATPEIENNWIQLRTGAWELPAGKTNAVAPLLTTKWNQAPYYNDLCPYDFANGGRTVVGCVATAMAQIMKYHNWPATGQGFHSYQHPTLGTISANFGNTNYSFSSMPNQLFSANTAVARLSFHCGVSVNMNYGVNESGVPLNQIGNVASALKNYFKYSSTVANVTRGSYTNSAWTNLLKTELDNSRPIFYYGTGTAGGHAFVFDGYDNFFYFHVNWGWSGSSDGYYEINALNPSALGIGGGAGGFNSYQGAIIGIKPNATAPPNYNIALSRQLSVNPSSTTFGTSVTVTFNIGNFGSGNFTGKAGAALYDQAGYFVQFIDSSASITLGNNQQYASQPTYTKTLNAVPGTYQIAALYKPNGGGWMLANNGSFTNPILFTVNPFSANITLTTTISKSANEITRGRPFTASWNLVNQATSSFSGSYATHIINSQGNILATIGTINANPPLQSGYTYTNPLQFTTNGIQLAPGSYFLAAAYVVNGNSYYVGGTTNFQNPIPIIVREPALQPDMYEVNNSPSSPYILPLNFSAGNTATVNTTGSNLHLSSDLDYYALQLPSGYSYTILHRVHDSYNSGNGKTYTCDVLYTYKTTGMSNPSAPIDDIPVGNIQMPNGGAILFGVSPYFAGLDGTYELSITVNRSLNTGIEDSKPQFSIFPNPSAGQFSILNPNSSTLEIQILDVLGNVIFVDHANDSLHHINLGSVSKGVYLVRLTSANGLSTTEKLVIQ